MKLCPRCHQRPATRDYCKLCNRELNEISRLKNPGVRVLMEWKAGPCVDCGIELPPEIMECDHVRGKSFQLSQTVIIRQRKSVDEVVAELAKCERRCPNCHRLRHYRQSRGLLDADSTD